MNERVRTLRKALGLSGEKFGAKLGLTRMAISNIENSRYNVTEQTIMSICREFNVNEEWLRSGTGDMFIETKETFLKNISKQYNLNDFDIKVLEKYISLSKDDRKVITDYIRSLTDPS